MARRRSGAGDPAEPRTFSPWIFVAGFAVLALIGLLGVLLGLGDGGTGRVQLEVPQTTSTTVVVPTTTVVSTTLPAAGPG
ncbi:MAG: hypothetical protein KGR17_02405 [Acidobacteria bacterium]|nr:hypothetical protein [Acidobacteriota bacterium]